MRCECGGELTKEWSLKNSITGEKKGELILCSKCAPDCEVKTVHSMFDRAEKAEAQVAELEAQVERLLTKGMTEGERESIREFKIKELESALARVRGITKEQIALTLNPCQTLESEVDAIHALIMDERS